MSCIILLVRTRYTPRRLMWREGEQLAEVHGGKNETLDSALRRFKRSCQKAGVLADVREHEHYDKPSVKKKKKSEAARKRKFK